MHTIWERCFCLPRGRQSKKLDKDIEQYKHTKVERANNPQVGLVSVDTDPDVPAVKYQYDPNLDPQLVWAGKAEKTSFDVETVSLHVHERIDPKTIIEAVRKKKPQQQLTSFFESAGEHPPYRDAIEFYRHKHGWSNRLIAGDSLLVMNSLLEKEGMAGKVQMVYIDPPYGIKYGSNFQPFINKRDVIDGKDEDLTQEPEMIKAFKDTWELEIHSYLTYLRDRLLLAKELLNESGSVFVQISDENIHLVRCLIDEVFEKKNFISLISFVTTSGFQTKELARAGDYLLWYSKNKASAKIHTLWLPINKAEMSTYRWIRLPDGTYRGLNAAEINGEKPIPNGSKLYQPGDLQSQGAASSDQPFTYERVVYRPGKNSHWKAEYPQGMERLAIAGRIHVAKNSIRYIRYADDFGYRALNNIWMDTGTGSFTESKIFVVQTNTKVIERCLLMTTDPGDLVFDPTCGSGTAAFAAEKWGRRWITCDTSRIAITLTKQRLMTAIYDYYTLRDPKEGIQSGFNLDSAIHTTLRNISKDEPPEIIELVDQPKVDDNKVRVTGPFTVEAVPAPVVISVGDTLPPLIPDLSVSRTGETRRQGDWRNEIFKSGIRLTSGEYLHFTRLEILKGARWLHAKAETKETEPKTVLISFGPDHAPLEQRQVERALEEASRYHPKPEIVIFAAFQFDPEAAKDIDEAKTGITLLKVQMNADLLTDDLKKKLRKSEAFWLIGQPDISIEKLKSVKVTENVIVTVNGFDYYDPRTGEITSGGKDKIAMWMLDPDYDGRSLYPRQVFFPLADADEGWAKLARNLKAEIDPELIEIYRGNISLPFTPGDRIAVKIVDDRGIESLVVKQVS